MPAIIVSGAIANKAGHGGEAWVRLNWALGLRKLGYSVVLVEQLAPESPPSAEAYFRRVTERFDFAHSAALLGADGETVVGLGRRPLLEAAAAAEALINISGHLSFEPVMERARRRVYIDIDPGFTQFWHAAGNAGARLAGHDFYFTIGANIGQPGCAIPTDGILWRPVRPPVVLREWPVENSAVQFEGFTTIASWRGPFGVVEFAGESYGLKVHEFRKFMDLPRATRLPFTVALNIHPGDEKDRVALIEKGWLVADPALAAGEPDAFRSYVQRSSAEFSVAQGIYVQTQSGWFSDRTAVYLASGKPALVQDTGFSHNLPTGEGLLAFRTIDEAIAGARSIAADYPAHCRAARRIAEEQFDSDRVLGRLLAEIDL